MASSVCESVAQLCTGKTRALASGQSKLITSLVCPGNTLWYVVRAQNPYWRRSPVKRRGRSWDIYTVTSCWCSCLSMQIISNFSIYGIIFMNMYFSKLLNTLLLILLCVYNIYFSNLSLQELEGETYGRTLLIGAPSGSCPDLPA